MRTVLMFTAGLALLAMIGCSSLQVSTDYDPEADFSTYKTFGWPGGDRPPDDALSRNPLLAKRIESSISRALEAKGYTIQEDGIPNIVIITHAGVQEKMQVTNYGGYYGGYGGYYGYGYSPWGYGYGGGTDVTYYDEGTLLIDFIDTETKELVWRGVGTKILGDSSNPEKIQANVDKVIDKMLAAYPPGSGTK